MPDDIDLVNLPLAADAIKELLDRTKLSLYDFVIERQKANPDGITDDLIKRRLSDMSRLESMLRIHAEWQAKDKIYQAKIKGLIAIKWAAQLAIIILGALSAGLASTLFFAIYRHFSRTLQSMLITPAYAADNIPIVSSSGVQQVFLIGSFLFLIFNSIAWTAFYMKSTDVKKSEFARRMVEMTVTFLIGALAGFLGHGA